MTLIKCWRVKISHVVPVVVTLIKPVPVGVPLNLIVLEAPFVTAFKPPGVLTSLIPVAEPPY